MPNSDSAVATSVPRSSQVGTCNGWPGSAEVLPRFTHVLTHLDWTLHPLRWTLPPRTAAARVAALTDAWPTGRWFSLEEALAAALPAPLRKLLAP